MTIQSLTSVLKSATDSESVVRAQVGAEWMQGRSVYGGLQAALGVQAMRKYSDGLPLRTLQATLCAPIAEGEVCLQSRLLRRGGSTRHVETSIVSGDQVLARFVGIFGSARDSVVQFDRGQMVEPEGEPRQWPYIDGVMPRFLQHLDVQVLKGNIPGSGQKDKENLFRVSLRDDVQSSDLPQVLAIADFPPPLGLSWLSGFKPGSTMTWMLNFTQHPVSGHDLSGWHMGVTLDAAGEGYTQQTVTLQAPDGGVVLRGTQCMVVFG